MRSAPDETQAAPSFFAFADAWASTRRVRDLPSLVQAITRVGNACFERYAVATVDVLIHGADPYVGLVAAWRVARQGKRVLLSFTTEMDVDASSYRLNARRAAHLPPEIIEYLQFRIAGFAVSEANYSDVLTTLCEMVMSMRGDDGLPLVHVSHHSQTLSPDIGISQNYPDAHIFWPFSDEQRSRDAAADDLRTLHMFVTKRLRPYRIIHGRMTVGYVCARHLVLTSRAPGYTLVPWRCRVTRLGAATDTLTDTDTSDYNLRRQDIDGALSFSDGAVT